MEFDEPPGEVDEQPREADQGDESGHLSYMLYEGWLEAQALLDGLYPPRSKFPSRPCTSVPRARPGHARVLTAAEAVVAKSILRLNVEEGA